MKLLAFASLLGLLATCTAIVYQDLDFEAVVIQDDPEDGIELEQQEDDPTTPSPGGGQSCTNANGVRGTCMKFEQCFPYTEGYDEETRISFQLYDILKEASTPSTPCEGEGNLICCPEYNVGIPIRKPQFEGMTSERPIASNSTDDSEDSDVKRIARDKSCGANQYQPLKVVGGRKAEIGEFPFAVALLNKGRQFCGGSLISPDWVLTAAHCIVNLRSFTNVKVNVGDHDVSKTSEVKHQPRGVKRGLYNKHFSMRTLEHDIALLQLDKPAELNEKVQPVCLSSNPPPYNEKAVLAGWGKTGKNLPPSPVLRTVTMRIIPHDECKNTYAKEPSAPPVKSGMVCAGEGSQGQPALKDACNGDSGGPLSLMNDKKATQIGVVSWGLGCGDKPGVYTRVDQYITWVDKNSKRS